MSVGQHAMVFQGLIKNWYWGLISTSSFSALRTVAVVPIRYKSSVYPLFRVSEYSGKHKDEIDLMGVSASG